MEDISKNITWCNQVYNLTTSVTAILNNLKWSLLSKRCQYSRLTLFFKFLHQDPPVIRIPQHYLPSTLTQYTRHTHHLHYIPPSMSTTCFQNSFFPKTITDWNNIIRQHYWKWHRIISPFPWNHIITTDTQDWTQI